MTENVCNVENSLAASLIILETRVGDVEERFMIICDPEIDARLFSIKFQSFDDCHKIRDEIASKYSQ